MPKLNWDKPTGRGELWRNLIIVRATTARQAVAKALRVGAEAEGDCRGTLRINGKPGLTKFFGVEAMGVIHENLEDGSEILWQLRECRQETARRLVKRRADLISSIESELEPKVPISDGGGRAVRRFIRAELLRLKRKRAVLRRVPQKR